MKNVTVNKVEKPEDQPTDPSSMRREWWSKKILICLHDVFRPIILTHTHTLSWAYESLKQTHEKSVETSQTSCETNKVNNNSKKQKIV